MRLADQPLVPRAPPCRWLSACEGSCNGDSAYACMVAKTCIYICMRDPELITAIMGALHGLHHVFALLCHGGIRSLGHHVKHKIPEGGVC